MKTFDFKKPKSDHLFQNVFIFANSFQMKWMEFTHKAINEQMQN